MAAAIHPESDRRLLCRHAGRGAADPQAGAPQVQLGGPVPAVSRLLQAGGHRNRDAGPRRQTRRAAVHQVGSEAESARTIVYASCTAPPPSCWASRPQCRTMAVYTQSRCSPGAATMEPDRGIMPSFIYTERALVRSPASRARCGITAATMQRCSFPGGLVAGAQLCLCSVIHHATPSYVC